jgi:ArsR family transcriptional regulator, arsenate/arsenite/antimonite-responsive transcriptional repressor
MNMETASLFKALSDTTRLRCVVLLARQGELCVCELTHILALPQPKVSHHLAALRKAGLVDHRKEGLWIYYRIREDLPPWVADVISAATQGTGNDPLFAADTASLGEIANRPEDLCCA